MKKKHTQIRLLLLSFIVGVWLGIATVYYIAPEPKEMKACVKTDDGVDRCVSGSIDDIRKVIYPVTVVNFTTSPSTPIIIHECENDTIGYPPCPPCPTCPNCEKCPTCEICEVCHKVDVETLKKARPEIENSAYQKGFFDMKRLCLVGVGEKPPKYDESPKPNLPSLNKKEDSMVCFRWLEVGHSFTMNYSTWNVRNESYLGRWYVFPRK